MSCKTFKKYFCYEFLEFIDELPKEIWRIKFFEQWQIDCGLTIQQNSIEGIC